MEDIIEQVACELGVDPVQVHDANILEQCRQFYSNFLETVQYQSKRAAASDFNRENRWRKRGVYAMPALWTLTADLDERGFVKVHPDGTVLVDTSGLELGQGLNTKVAQAVAMAFKGVASDFDMSLVEIVIPKSTATFSGCSGTWGSGTSEACVSAALQACAAIADKLKPFASAGRSWKGTVAAACNGSADLSASGEHPPAASFKGYHVSMAACVVAEIDVLTGEWQVLSADLHQD